MKRRVADSGGYVKIEFVTISGISLSPETQKKINEFQAEVARNDRQSDIKRGPGGIREIEFLVQALQLIRGGRDASLRTPSLLKALDALVAAGELTAENADQLRELYRFLRVLENRIQMLRDEQTHDVPAAASDRERVAIGLGYANWAALQADLDVVRTAVQQEFNGGQFIHWMQ